MTLASSDIRAQDLELKVETDRTEYLEGEQIYVISTMTNTSQQIRNCPRFYLQSRCLDYQLMGPDGQRIPYSGDVFSYSLSKVAEKLVHPGKSIQNVQELLRSYHNFMEEGTAFPLPLVARLLPGTYTLSASYEFDDARTVSNTVTFTITAPRGEDAEAFEILKKKFTMDYYAGENYDKKVAEFTELSSKYKSSNYNLLIKQNLRTYLWQKGDTVNAKQVIRELIKSNPNTGTAIINFKWLNLAEQEKDVFIKELKQQNPNSRVSKYIEIEETK